MRFVVDLFDVVLRGRQIDLGRRNIFVSHEFLQRLQIGAVLKHMYSEGVP